MKRLIVLAFTAIPAASWAGGSNYGITPGVLPNLAGKVSEWPVPTPRFARDPAIAPDGSVYITVMNGNKVARFDPKTETFKEWDLPPGHRPHGLLVDSNGMVWTTGNGNGTIGKLDPASGKMIEYKTPSGGGGPHTLIINDDQSTIWFTMQSGDKVASLDTKTGKITDIETSGGPYGLALDKAGNVWFCRMGDNKMGQPRSAHREDDRGRTPAAARTRGGWQPTDGMLWVTLLRQRQARQARSERDEGREDLSLARRQRRPVRGHRRWRRHGLGQRDQHRHGGALRSEDREDAGRASCPPNVGIRKMVTDRAGACGTWAATMAGWAWSSD